MASRLVFSLVVAAAFAAPALAAPAFAAPARAAADPQLRGSAATDPEQTIELPMAGQRELNIEAAQVTWMSLDVAPAGDRLVLEILGDLFQLPIAGGEATPLTTGLAFDSQPRFSPDGSQIVFVSDRGGLDELWLMNADGSDLRRLTKGSARFELASPTWSPDGEHVVVSRQSWGLRTFELWAYHLNGGTGVQLTEAKAKPNTPANDRSNSLGPVYSADGETLFYARKNGGFAYNIGFPQWQIARRNLRDGTETLITGLQGSAFKPALSPDGRLLAYATRVDQQTRLRVRDLVSGIDRTFDLVLEADEQESRFTRDLLPNYAFSPDGQAIFISSGGRPHRLDLETGVAVAIPLHFRSEQQLGNLSRFRYSLATGPVKARALQQPDLAADGSALVFSAFRQIYRFELASGTLTALSPPEHAAFFPRFAPDGQSIVYLTWAEEGGHIYRLPIAGGRPQRLTRYPGHYHELAFSPDGERLVTLRGSTFERRLREYDSGSTLDADLAWLPATGGELTVIAPGRGLSRLHFAEGSERVYFNVNSSNFARGDAGGLASIRFDGSDRREELSVTGPGIYSAEAEVQIGSIRLAPDRKTVALRHADQLYLSSRLSPALGGQKTSLTAAGLPAVRLTSVGADHSLFDRRGEAIYWLVGHTLYRRAFDTISWQPEAAATDGAADEGTEKDAEQADATAQIAPDFDGFEALEADPAVSSWQIEVYRPRARPAGRIALVGGRVLPMTGQGTVATVIEDATVLIEGDRITAIGPRSTVTVPPATEVIDVTGKSILPGYVDPHAHFRPYRDVMAASDWALQANLAFGVTTGLDVQPSTLDILAYEEATDAGLLLGPRTLSTGPGIFSNNDFQSLADAYFVLKRYRDHYGVHNLKAYISGDRRQRQWLVQAARELRLNPTTEGSLDMRLGITHALDGFSGNEHNFPLQDLYPDLVQLVAGSGMSYVPTLLVLYGGPSAEEHYYSRESPAANARLRRFTPKPFLDRRTLRRGSWVADAEERFAQVARQALKLARAGTPVGVGSHGQLQGLGFHWELWALGTGGFAPVEALRAATIGGATIIGIDQDIGTLEVGKLADLVVLNSDPLADLRLSADVSHVMRGGYLFNAETLDRVWPEPAPLPVQWWQQSADQP